MKGVATKSAEMYPYALCDCNYFTVYLKRWIFRTLSEKNEPSMWITFRNKIEQYSRIFTLLGGSYFNKSCSLKTCSALLSYLEEIKRNGMTLSTQLIRVVSDIHSREEDNKCYCGDIQNGSCFSRQRETIQILSAFRGDSNFMKVLLSYGLVSSFPDESPLLYNEAFKNICYFM